VKTSVDSTVVDLIAGSWTTNLKPSSPSCSQCRSLCAAGGGVGIHAVPTSSAEATKPANIAQNAF